MFVSICYNYRIENVKGIYCVWEKLHGRILIFFFCKNNNKKKISYNKDIVNLDLSSLTQLWNNTCFNLSLCKLVNYLVIIIFNQFDLTTHILSLLQPNTWHFSWNGKEKMNFYYLWISFCYLIVSFLNRQILFFHIQCQHTKIGQEK